MLPTRMMYSAFCSSESAFHPWVHNDMLCFPGLHRCSTCRGSSWS